MWGRRLVRVLRRAGAEVAFPAGQTCCGQPAFNAGLWEQARPVACHTIQVFERTRGAVVVPSGSCAAMLRHSYLELFAEDREWLPHARALAERVYEFSEFLVDHLGVVDLGASYTGTAHLPLLLPPAARNAGRPPAASAAVSGARRPDRGIAGCRTMLRLWRCIFGRIPAGLIRPCWPVKSKASNPAAPRW